jgi:hypothetical protein
MESLERGLVLAKQVLSQLSYTPTYNHMILMDFLWEGPPTFSNQVSPRRANRPHGATIILPTAYGDFFKATAIMDA